jgi:hypothetical protein
MTPPEILAAYKENNLTRTQALAALGLAPPAPTYHPIQVQRSVLLAPRLNGLLPGPARWERS